MDTLPANESLLLEQKALPSGLNEAIIHVLSHPWTVVSTIVPSEIPPWDDPEYAEWRLQHQESHLYCTELFLALDGEGAFGLRDKVYRITPGQCILATSKDRHDTGRSLSPGFFYCCLHFYPNYTFWDLFELRDTEYCSLGIQKINWPLAMGAYQILENLHHRPFDDIQRRRYLESLLECTRLEMLASPPKTSSGNLTLSYFRIAAAMRHIESTHGRDASAEHLARKAGYSKGHFLRLFQSFAGESLRDYVNHVRYSAFCELTNQGMSNKNIAYEIGFSSPVALSHWLSQQRRKALDYSDHNL